MITTTKDLADAVKRARAGEAVGIDTEFVWERTYYPTLGVVQIGYPDGHCELVDAAAIADWSPFAALMEDPDTVKILHDAVQDLVILRRTCGALPKRIFDTQRAAGFIGLASTISLQELLKTLLKVRLTKSETRSDWLARPLTEEQIHYAEEDVRYATRLRDKILGRAEELGRRAWIEEEMESYEAEELYLESEPDMEMPRVRGSGTMTRGQRGIMRALGAWRERMARKRNLPRQFILSDAALVTLSKSPPPTFEALRPMKGMSERVLQRHRKPIWDAIKRGRENDLPDLPIPNANMPSPDEGHEARVDLALAFVKGTSLKAEVDPALVANRAEITALVLEAGQAGPERHRLLRGWRGALCGAALLALLRGEGSISVDSRTGFPVFGK
ncbi:MAG: ribonuclease D [Opitutales bacterium]